MGDPTETAFGVELVLVCLNGGELVVLNEERQEVRIASVLVAPHGCYYHNHHQKK
jgi:hypothetical protein